MGTRRVKPAWFGSPSAPREQYRDFPGGLLEAQGNSRAVFLCREWAWNGVIEFGWERSAMRPSVADLARSLLPNHAIVRSTVASSPEIARGLRIVMGIIPLWLFPRRKMPLRCAIVGGDGKFRFHFASDAKQRGELQRLFGNRSNDIEHRCPALLIPRPGHPRGPDTVAVRIEDATIGYLHPTGARMFMAAIAQAAPIARRVPRSSRPDGIQRSATNLIFEPGWTLPCRSKSWTFQ